MLRQLVGILNYLTITQIDISFAVQQVSQFMQAHHHLHLVAVRRIICYLLGTSTHGLFFPNGYPIRLNAFSDSTGCPDTRRSVTGHGKVKRKIVCQNLQLRLNVDPCLLLALRLYGFVDYFLRLDFLNLILLLSMLII